MIKLFSPSKKTSLFIIILLSSIVIITQESENNPSVNDNAQISVEDDDCLNQPDRGIVLSFDDSQNIQSWGSSRDYLSSRGVKATFFVDHWSELEQWELDILRNLSKDGHEIGFHGTNHLDFFDFIGKNLTAQDYFNEEILPGLKAMRDEGFDPTSYAYPRGHRNSDIDDLILQEFSVLRGTRSYANGTESWIVACEDSRVFQSFPLITKLDNETRANEREYWINYAFNQSEANDITINLNGHGIGNGSYPISLATLDVLVEDMKRTQLPFLLMSDLAT